MEIQDVTHHVVTTSRSKHNHKYINGGNWNEIFLWMHYCNTSPVLINMIAVYFCVCFVIWVPYLTHKRLNNLSLSQGNLSLLIFSLFITSDCIITIISENMAKRAFVFCVYVLFDGYSRTPKGIARTWVSYMTQFWLESFKYFSFSQSGVVLDHIHCWFGRQTIFNVY